MCRKNLIRLTGILLMLSGMWKLHRNPLQFSGFLTRLKKIFWQVFPETYYAFDINPEKNYIYYYLALIAIFTGSILLIKYKSIALYCSKLLKHFQKALNLLSNLNPLCKKLLAGLLIFNLLIKWYYLTKMPVFVDEAWTYFVFSSKGFLTAISYYPAPNNHILHSILTVFSVQLPVDILTALRLPNFLANIIAVLLFFIVISKLFSNKTALFFSLVFSTMFPMMYYGYIARGYIFYLIGFIVLFYIAVNSLRNQRLIKAYFPLWLLATITGFYSIPTFLYPYMSIYLYLSIYFYKNKDWKSFKNIQIINLISAISVLLIYFPVLLISGIKSLIDNPYVKPHNRISVLRNFDEHFDDTSWFLFNLPLIASLFIALIYFYLLHKKKWIHEVKFAFFILIFSPLIMLIHATLPMPRIWIYWLIPVLFLSIHIYEIFIKDKYGYRLQIYFFSSIALLQLLIFHIRLPRYEADSFLAKKIANELIQKKVNRLYTGKNNYLGTSILFHYKQNKLDLNIFEAFDSLSDKDFAQFQYFLMRNPIDSITTEKYRPDKKIFRFYSARQYLYQKMPRQK